MERDYTIVQYAINDAQSTATGKTPNFVTFGTERIEREEKPAMEGESHQEIMKIIHKEVERDLEWTEKERKNNTIGSEWNRTPWKEEKEFT